MIRVYRSGSTAWDTPVTATADWILPPDALWIDMLNPTPDEDRAVENAVGLSIPTREEMAELEASSRLYRRGAATYAVADILSHADAEIPGLEPVTFVLTPGPLVTIRYFEPRPFAQLTARIEQEPDLCTTGPTLFLNLMEAIIDRASDVLGRNAARVEAVAEHVFGERKTVGFAKLITKLGQAQIANARIEQSLSSLARLFAFVALDDRLEQRPEPRDHLRSLTRDAQSLISHAQSVAASIDFQLSAALGLINIEQSSIIKIFSVAAVAFMPPTLIASIYGMNFHLMPELSQPWGYPAALLAMVVAAVLPLLWFKHKGWL